MVRRREIGMPWQLSKGTGRFKKNRLLPMDRLQLYSQFPLNIGSLLI